MSLSAEPPDLSSGERAAMRVRNVVKPTMSIFRERYSPLEWVRNRKADVFLVWFPKTGGTWIRLLLSGALSRHTGVVPDEPLDFSPYPKADPSVPRIRWLHDDEPHWKRPHQLHASKERYRGKKVVLLVRDPRDALVSLYFQMTRRWKVTDASLGEFLRQPRGTIETLVRYYNIWADQRGVPDDLVLIRYEDVHEDTAGTLRTLLDFCGLERISDDIVQQSVEANRIGAQREREARTTEGSARLRPGVEGDPESFKARRGKVGGYVDYLGPEDIERLSAVIEGGLDPWYGYSGG